jgi:hypothetical protein
VLVGLALIIAGLALAGVTLWFWRAAQPDNPVLAPLEVMGEERYLQADEFGRKEMLRQVRVAVDAPISQSTQTTVET